LSEEKYRLLK
jgi:hypothetical protein